MLNVNEFEEELNGIEDGFSFEKNVSSVIDFEFLANSDLSNAEKIERLKNITEKLESSSNNKDFQISSESSYSDEEEISAKFEISQTVKLTPPEKEEVAENFISDINSLKKNLHISLEHIESYLDMAGKIGYEFNPTTVGKFIPHIEKVEHLLARESSVFDKVKQVIKSNNLDSLSTETSIKASESYSKTLTERITQTKNVIQQEGNLIQAVAENKVPTPNKRRF